MRAIAIILLLVLMLGLIAATAGCPKKGGDAEGKGGMTTDELRDRGPQPPSGMKQGDGKAGAPAGGPSKSGG
jgi:hypothetical protein